MQCLPVYFLVGLGTFSNETSGRKELIINSDDIFIRRFVFSDSL